MNKVGISKRILRWLWLWIWPLLGFFHFYYNSYVDGISQICLPYYLITLIAIIAFFFNFLWLLFAWFKKDKTKARIRLITLGFLLVYATFMYASYIVANQQEYESTIIGDQIIAQIEKIKIETGSYPDEMPNELVFLESKIVGRAHYPGERNFVYTVAPKFEGHEEIKFFDISFFKYGGTVCVRRNTEKAWSCRE